MGNTVLLLVSFFICLSFGRFSFAFDYPKDEPSDEAPRQGQLPGSWTTGNKDFFGTSYESYDGAIGFSSGSSTAPISKVWYTGAHGILNEVYWPSVDKPQTRDSQILISDGKSFLLREADLITTTKWLTTGVPAFQITSHDPQNRFIIEKTVVSNPVGQGVFQKIKISRKISGLKFYYLHNPQVSNTPMDDSGVAIDSKSQNPGLYASQAQEAQAVQISIGLKQASAGFEGVNDGYQDLTRDFRMDYSYSKANIGNVALMAWLDLPETSGESDFYLGIGFGKDLDEARKEAQELLSPAKFDSALQKFAQEWRTYQAGLTDLGALSGDGGILYRNSVAVLKSMEDKTASGAFVASPTIPWGQYQQDTSSTQNSVTRKGEVGGYHLVWPRDLYQMATSFMAIGDNKTPIAVLNYFKKTQFDGNDGNWVYGPRNRSRDGTWAQNMWTNGSPYWNSLQMDQTAFPVLLTYRLWKSGLIEINPYFDMMKRAADAIQEYGPWSAQERWEENYGASPSTIAAEISAMWVASEMAQAKGDSRRALLYGDTGDAWSFKPKDNLEAWLFTTSGTIGNGKYYTRIEASNALDQVWDPNDDSSIKIANGGGIQKEKAVLDGGFLELVRYGVRNALSYYIQETVSDYDANLKQSIPDGPGYYRYTGDFYNYDDTNGEQTRGMLWPLLTGERGHYEIAKARESHLAPDAIERLSLPYQKAIENFATPTYMIPEQVWSQGSRAGKPTGSATPLGWSHAEYIKLLRSRRDHKVFDLISSVSARNSKGELNYLKRHPVNSSNVIRPHH